MKNILLYIVLFNIVILYVFLAILLSCVVNIVKCDANILLYFVFKEKLELILLLKPLSKKY